MQLLIAATTTLHSADGIEVFLRHVAKVGASGVLFADLASKTERSTY